MRTSLIYPGIAGYGFESLGKGMEAGWVSHGLAHLSSAAKAQGFSVDLIDLRALSGWDAFGQELRQRRPDVTALTMMSVDYNPAIEAARVIKEVLPETVVVAGGPHPTIMVEEVAEILDFDYIVTREGEVTFPWLLGELRDGRQPENRVLEGDLLLSPRSGWTELPVLCVEHGRWVGRSEFKDSPGAGAWDASLAPLVVATFVHLSLGHFALAPFFREVFGTNPISDEWVEQQTKFMATLIRQMFPDRFKKIWRAGKQQFIIFPT